MSPLPFCQLLHVTDCKRSNSDHENCCYACRSLCVYENRRGHCDLGVTSIGSLIAHLKILATTHLAHLHHQLVATGRKVLVNARPLLFTMAAIVVDNPLAIQEQERAVVRSGVELVVAGLIDAHIAAAPDAEVIGLPDVREAAVVHVDVRQNLGMSRVKAPRFGTWH